MLQGFTVQLLEKSDTAEHSRVQTATGIPPRGWELGNCYQLRELNCGALLSAQGIGELPYQLRELGSSVPGPGEQELQRSIPCSACSVLS